MENKIIKIKNGVTLHFLNTDLFKTNIISAFITTPLTKENVTKNALIPAILKSGSTTMQTQEQINKKLEELYGATFNCGVDKNGDNQILKFYIESIDNKYLPNEEKVLEESINMFLDIIFNPLTENGMFKQEYFDMEKENLRKIIGSKKDDKSSYALFSCLNKIYNDNGFGIFKYGYIEKLDDITNKDLFEYYKNFIEDAKIDIFISGNFDSNKIQNLIQNNPLIANLKEHTGNYILNNVSTENKQKVDNYREEIEKLDVVQGKLIIGLDILSKQENLKFIAMVYNTILGDGANSMLFQNVREKASLAYSARSLYIKQKSNIFIICGIEIDNYNETVKIIKEQLDNLKLGNFTEENIENAKKYIYSGIDLIDSEQDTGIIYYFGQELSKSNTSPTEYKQKISQITKDQIIDLANNIQINMIYFLRN